jgi:hypothetical protein
MNSANTPVTVKISSLGLFIFPLASCVIGFRLYEYPNNPDAWFIWVVLQIIYSLGGILVLKRFGFVRWVWAASLLLTSIFGFGKIAAIWQSPYPYLAIGTCAALVTKITLLTLLFTPSANAFFQRKPA